MKRILIAICLTTLFISAGCMQNDGTKERDRVIDQMDPHKDHNPNEDGINDDMGFVRYKKTDVSDDEELNRDITMDRTKMANMITRVILENDGFDEVATLVTNKDVLIAYQRNDSIEEDVAANQAKGAAQGMMPRFFDVYVSDQETLINDIQSLHNSSTLDRDYERTVDKIITEMEKSSQGTSDPEDEDDQQDAD